MRHHLFMKKYWVVQKVIAFFPIDDVVHVLWAWHECQMFTRVFLLTLNLKIKKKVDASQRSSFAIMVRTWRILKSIFAIFCFINSKKGRKQLKQRKSCVEFMTEMSSKKSARTGSPDSVMVIFQSKTLITPVDLPRLTTMKWKYCKYSTVWKLATALKAMPVGSVHGHLKSLGFIKKLDVWGPHELKEIHLTNRMSVCDQLIKREENDPFLKCMIMGNEKWMFITISAEKEVGVGEVKHRKGKQRRSSIKRR